MEKKGRITVVAEGTYPYVKGGVSHWIHELITSLEEFDFYVVFLGSRREDYGDYAYRLPDNVIQVAEYFLFESKENYKPSPEKFRKDLFEKLSSFHKWFRKTGGEIPPELQTLSFYSEKVREKEFLHGKTSWEFICENYFKFASDLPFIDYFWTVRNMHAPLWKLASIVKEMGRCDLVHSPSTGYAGFLASIIEKEHKVPFILTEHGIYIRERKIDILNAEWIRDERYFFQKELGEIEHFRKMWISFFVGLGKMAYRSSKVIISLFEEAKRVQISLGAPKEKTKVIPNGVKIELYEKARKSKHRKPVVALVGRVVPVKDIKTFIKGIKILVSKNEEVEGWIVGPTDEDPDYYEECRKLIKVLDIESKVKFLGYQKTVEVFSQVKVAALTSISEGMPLVILEAFASGIPFVATDVGSCRQLIYGGLNEEDLALGKAGFVVPVASPGDFAQACWSLLSDEELWRSCSNVAYDRVKRFYSFESFVENYRKLYEDCLSGGNIL